MRRIRIVLALLGTLVLCSVGDVRPSYAEDSATPTAVVLQTVVFEIENMNCALCPVTVRTAMEDVDGVASVEVDFDSKTATVVFDPAIATIEAIAKASADAGYPARSAEG
jgi:mercuric ion binding protein